jgi:hypothetical protein
VPDGAQVWDATHWPTSLIANTIIANIPQLIFSTLYFAFNNIMSSMALAAEWSKYGIFRKGLRLSWDPKSAQRSSYFLSLPYRYAVPLMASSAILHWLISQSLFLVGIEAYDSDWKPTHQSDLTTRGYTPAAIVCSLSLGVFMLICLLATGSKKLSSGMPVAGSCSFAISAACHPRYNPNLELGNQGMGGDEGSELMPVKWGAVAFGGVIGHCTFSSDEVDILELGHIYQ